MKAIKNLAVAIVAIIVSMSFMTSCTSVEPGEAGLKVYKLGSKKGTMEVVGIGRHTLNWFGYFEILTYPTNLRQWSWTASETEGSMNDESVHFQSEGQDLSCDIGIAFNFATDEER